MGDDTEWLKLPTDDKVQHKAWKARQAGYEEAIKLFQTIGDEKSPEFSKYLGLVKKFVVDNNAIAQEKGLEATLAFVENAACAGKAVGEVCTGIIAKCLNQRAKTKDLGVAILMTYIEAEKHEIVQEELMKGLANKQPKIVAVCVVALREALRDFGTKIVSIKPILKQLQPLLEDRDKTVRDEAKLLTVEIYRWIGGALKPHLASLKPLQVAELEAEFEKLPPIKPQQSRFLRSQQDLKAKMQEKAAAGDEESGADVMAVDGPNSAPDIDPYDLIDPVDILSKLPKDFYEKVEEKKWQERREVLDAVQKLADIPKLEQGDYSDLMRALKKVVSKDSNVMLVTTATKCISLIALGLRKKFAPHAVGCIEVLIEKFREKKPNVVQTLKEAIDSCFASTNLEGISEACIAALDHKTPSVKAETASFLARCFSQCTPATLPKKLLKLFVAALLKAVNDSSGEVREAAFEALGTAMKVITEKAMMPFLADVDNLKMAKIKECCEKAAVVGKAGTVKGSAGESLPAAASKPAVAASSTQKAPTANTTGAKPIAKKSAESSVAPSTSSVDGGKKKVAGPTKGKKGAAEAKEEVLERELSDETVEEKMAALFPGGELAGLDNANWKERLTSVEKMTEVVKRLSREEIPTQAFVRTICKKPGLKETNFQVLKLKVDLISFLAANSQFTKKSVQFCLTDLMEKIGDQKNGAAVQEALSSISEATSLDFVALQVVQYAFEQKNPKNQSESLNWLATAIKQFGFKITVKPLVETIGKALASANPAVRTSAITLLGVMYMYMGATLRIFFDSEKPALLQQIDAEFEKVKGEKAPVPIRGVQPMDDVSEETEDREEGGSGDAALINIADLIPRTDINEKMTEGLMNELADKNWKVRKEGLDKVQSILNEAKFITANIGPLPEALKLRLLDSNKILVTITLSICQTLATSMGPNVKQHVRVVGPGLISNLGDSKPNIRQQAVAALNAWVEQTGLQVFVEAEMFSDALKVENPNLRAELLGWMAEKLPTCKKLPAELLECVGHLFSCMEDRNADVRKKAQEALVPFMIHTGYEGMVRQTGKLKPASKDPVMKALEAARQNLPQKPKATAAPTQPVTVKGGGGGAKVAQKTAAAAAKTDYDEDDVDDVSSRPSTASSKTSVTGKGKGKANGGTTAAGVAKKGSATVAGPSQSKKKGQEEEDTSPPLKVSNGKDQRFKDEKNLKVFKWNFPSPRPEFIEQLKLQMEPTFNKALMDQLFHADFKFHIKAMDSLVKICEGGSDSTIANLDLLLKWLTLRFFDTNTTVLMKALEYLTVVFNTLIDEDYHLHELEAVSFIPYIINKVGDPKDNIRRDVHNIIQLICKIHPSSKIFSYIIEGLKSKNAKQRTECLDELGILIMSYGINVCQPSPAVALKLIAQQISDRDNSVRSAALNTIVAAHGFLGEAVFRYVGILNDKDQSMLEERIKRSGKNRPPIIAAPTGPATSNPRMSPDEKLRSASAAATAKASNKNALESRPATGLQMRSKGQFQLDFEEIDTTENYAMPKLIEPDLNDILDEPIKLPVTRMRPPSPAVKLLHSSADAKSAVDLVISQIASNDITTSLQALHQIDEVLKEPEKAEALVAHVDHLLIACTLQLRVTYTKHMSDNEMNREVIRLYRCLLATLISLCKCGHLAHEATRDVLKDLVYNLITILLDNRLAQLDDGNEVVRAVNVTVVKFVEHADATNIMSALIKLLHESVGIETCSIHFLELVMKCLWKMVRMLPAIINDLNLDRVIADMNQFMKAFPGYTWKTRTTDMPLRTIKTILHSMARIKGNKILNHLTLIDRNDHSEVESYLRKVLRSSSDNEQNVSNANSRNEQLNGSIDTVTTTTLTLEGTESGRKSPRRISRTVHDTLADIFKKIGSKENTREGLNNLYDFKMQHPDADLDPFLKKSSQFFQDYIERGLKTIAQEREGKAKVTTSSSAAESIKNGPASNVSNSVSNESTDVSAAEYLERLKVLRARCGLDNSKLDTDTKLRTDSASSSESINSKPELAKPSSRIASKQASTLNSGSEGTDEGSSALSNLDELKKRLEKIKNARKD